MPTEILTPVGRVVWGRPGVGQIKKNMRTGDIVLKKDGTQVQQWVFGLAIPKADFTAHVWPGMHAEAAPHFPQGIPGDFAWKFKDGDTGVDKKGRPLNLKEGYPGHYVLTISTEAFTPQIFKFENGAYRQITSEDIKCGDYVAVKLIVAYNGNEAGDGAGVYLNPKGIELVGYGTEIITGGADPDEMFSGVNRVLPPGASLTPVSSAPGGYAPQQPAPAGYAPVQYAQPPVHGALQPVYVPPAQPVTYHVPPQAVHPAPAHDFVQAAVHGAPQQPAPAGYAPAQPVQYAQPGQQPAPGGYYQPPMPGMPAGR